MRIKRDNAISLLTKSERFQSSWEENSTRLSIWSPSAHLIWFSQNIELGGGRTVPSWFR
jgi:hypothetical protein